MRNTIVTAAAALALLGAGALTVPAAAADQDRPGPGAASSEATPDPTLATARRVLAGNASPRDPSATLALRDLWLAKPRLRGAERRQAESLLARPTDGLGDPAGFGYTVAEQPPLCNTRLCLHYVGSGTDAPPSPDWANLNLAVMDSVWALEVDQFGYRPPLTDGVKGGSPQFDVYLKDLGGDLYGFCAGETRVKKRTASGYCVLDNDFSVTQFPTGTPEGNLRVTAAHEFFHAIQYAYDYAEDPWMMESTATWMEERYATDVNDNLQYLPSGQLYAPYRPLDLFSRTGLFQYGNWTFWEYLSTNYGTRIVNKAWKQAGSLKSDGGKNSIASLQKVLRGKGGLTKVYAKYAAANLTPATTYPEGAAYAAPELKDVKTLKKGKSKRFSTRVNHLASRSYGFVPGKGTSGKKRKLALRVTGPAKRTSPAAVVALRLLNGKVQTKLVKLNRNGDGRIKVSFDSGRVGAVTVTLVNASTRYACNRRTLLACGGKPLDDKARFSVVGRAVKR
ncbi:MAG: DUF6055 domain-containing protein [Nocardioides sp.]|nr:DUF6055 domain-containing protein [Nocardioides sp.]